LIFGLAGAIGIAAASFAISYYGVFPPDLVTCIGIGLISGFAPLLAKWLVVSSIPINNDLSNLSIQKIILCIIVYALMSAGLHQFWFELRDLESGSLNHFLVMFIGDIAGSILLIALIKYSIDLLKRSKPKHD
jgi:predicted MPP superfamily phosphohydrolase